MAKRYDPIMCMMVDEPTKAQDAEGEKWITMRGSHVKIDGEGNAVAGNAKVKNIINNGKAGSSKESSGSTREKLSKMSRSDLNHFAEMYGDYDDAESFRKEDIIEDMIEEHGEEKVGKMLNTFNEMFSKGKEKKKENPVVAKKKNESANSNASAREKLSGMSRSDLEHFAEMYGGYEDARGVRKDDIIDDMIDDYGEEKVNKMLETYNGIFKKKGKDSASALDKAIKTADGATGDKLYADVKAIYSLFSNILLTYSNEQSVQKLANEGTKKCLELAAKVKGVRDEAIKACDASTGHKVVVFVENYLRSIGKNNSTGKYDRIVQGVRSLLSQSLLDDEGLKKAAEHEADRLLKKYNL